MGWLDNSTNNIILDAVLTDYGRQKLAAANGSNSANGFSIFSFALGDDEVNYNLVKKYGRTIGREKIEKNTPVFEAFTNQNLSQKYRLFSAEQNPIIYLPKLTSNIAQVTLTPGNSQLITINQIGQGGEPIPVGTQETEFEIFVPDLFLNLSGGPTASGAADISRIKMYQATAVINNNIPTLNFTISRKTITDTMFDVYGRATTGNQRIIDTSVRITGRQTGISLDLPIDIYKLTTPWSKRKNDLSGFR